MKTGRTLGVGVTVALLCAGTMRIAAGQGGVFAYPTKGQSEQQQAKDQAECQHWATRQTGVNPAAPPPPPVPVYASAPPPSASGGLFGFGSGQVGRGGVLGDATRGAAIGAVGGAIAGDAGKGAAIGAATSTVFGGIRRQSRQAEEARWQQSQQAAAQQQQAMAYQQQQQQLQTYHQAYKACMSGRGYSVQ